MEHLEPEPDGKRGKRRRRRIPYTSIHSVWTSCVAKQFVRYDIINRIAPAGKLVRCGYPTHF